MTAVKRRVLVVLPAKAKAKVPTQADCVAHGLMLAAMSGMFRKNGW